jgi:alginate O-acetyltransferase complex protein AlgI
MLFASFDFLIFLPVVLGGFWLLSKRPRARFALLVVASYFFYCAGPKPSGGPLPPPWYFVGLLATSTLVDYVAGLAIGRARERGATGRAWLYLSLATNLGLLGYFKYTGFLLQIARSIADSTGLPGISAELQVVLPIGISFYTFQSLSYTIDVWRGRLEPERSFVRFALFVAYFPQLIAGPIVRAADFLPQLRSRLSVTREDVDFAIFRICKGILKKVVLGDFIAARFTDVVFAAPASYSSLENLLALYAFTLQIYADFSGYSDIAIGTARLFGVRLPENFERPYQSASVAEFWRRWHVTLSTWLRDYVFFPLGGSRGGLARTCFNLWLTMFLIGMWHGASYNFVIYANLQAAAMVLHRISVHRWPTRTARLLASAGVALAAAALGFSFARLLGVDQHALSFCVLGSVVVFVLSGLAGKQSSWLGPINVFFTFHFVVISRIFFRADSLDLASAMSKKLLVLDGLGARPGMFRFEPLKDALLAASLPDLVRPAALAFAEHAVLGLIAFGLAIHFLPARWTERAGQRLIAIAPAAAIAGLIALLGVALPRLLASGPRANIYFAF